MLATLIALLLSGAPLTYQQLDPHRILILQPTPVATVTAISTPTPTPSKTATPSPTASSTPTQTATSTFTPLPTNSPTATPTDTVSAAPTATPTVSTSVYLVTSQTQQGPTDLIKWNQMGGNGIVVPQGFSVTSIGAVKASISLGGPNSILAAVCPATPCSWAGVGMPSGDVALWTSNGNNGGNGPIAIDLSAPVAGIGAYIQADGPAAFTARIVVSDANGVIGSFTETSSTGKAIYIGAVDRNSSIVAAIFSLTTAMGSPSDFAIDTLNLGGTF